MTTLQALFPWAPRRLPLVGHTTSFKPARLCQYLEETALSMESSWCYRLDLVSRQPMVVGDPALAQAIVARKELENRQVKSVPAFRDMSREVLGLDEPASVVFGSGPVRWGVPRKAAEDGLRRRAFVDESVRVVERHTQRMVDTIPTNTPIDVSKIFASCALDIVGELAFKERLGAADGNTADGLQLHITTFLQHMSKLAMMPFPYWRYFANTDYHKMISSLEMLIRLSAPIVEKRRKVERIECFIDMLLAGNKEKLLKDDEIVFNAVVILAAGHDTTSNTLAFASLLLATRPELQERLRNGDDFLLTAVIKETMRLYPAAPIFGRFHVGSEALNVAIPDEAETRYLRIDPGSSFLISPYLLGRNPRVWGSDVLDFKPERFSLHKGRAGQAHAYAFLPFGHGGRGCVGSKLAMLEAKTILSTLLKKYSLSLAPNQSPTPEPRFNFTLSNQGGVHVVLEPVPQH